MVCASFVSSIHDTQRDGFLDYTRPAVVFFIVADRRSHSTITRKIALRFTTNGLPHLHFFPPHLFPGALLDYSHRFDQI